MQVGAVWADGILISNQYKALPFSSHCTRHHNKKIKFQNIEYDKTLSPFIKSIMVFECDEGDTKTNLPFFADGFPGLMYHETPNGLYVNPHKKRMPQLFVYGQTIEPIEIKILGGTGI